MRLPSRFVFALFRLFCLIGLLGLLWGQHLSHFNVSRDPVAREVVVALQTVPGNVVLDEIGSMAVGGSVDLPDADVVAAADQIVAGRMPALRFFRQPVPLIGYPQDYRFGPPSFQLTMASLEPERILLQAFERSGDPRFLERALERTLAFARHQAGQRNGDGFLFNDHAVGTRMAVLVRLWRHLRAGGRCTAAEVAPDAHEPCRELLSLALRDARFLADPRHFTVRTNHGVVQNIALLQFAAAFPAMPEAPGWRELALRRLQVQTPFYLSREGVVLEHSAGYHYFGVELLSLAIRLSVLNGVAPDPELMDKLERGRAVLARMIRPDGSLPLVGNTGNERFGLPIGPIDGSAPVRHSPPPHSVPPTDGGAGVSLLPLSGYAIWWAAGAAAPSQTLIAWAAHQGHGHKHADEMSLSFWSGGVDWITNSGYWPYGAPGQGGVESWAGSNAPHEPGEATNSVRVVRLLGSGSGSGSDSGSTGPAADRGLRFVDLQRDLASGARLRRQVVQLDARTLVVLDFAQAAASGIETLWTVDPILRLKDQGARQFLSSAAGNGARLALSHASAGASTLDLLRGSLKPFAGWVVRGEPLAADTVRVTAAGPRSLDALLIRTVAEGGGATQNIAIEAGAAPENWVLAIETPAGKRRLLRAGGRIQLQQLPGPTGRESAEPAPVVAALDIAAPPDLARQQLALRAAYSDAVAQFPQWRDLSVYRAKLSYLLIGLWLLAELAWFAVRRIGGAPPPGRVIAAHLLLAAAWVTVAIWIFWFYLV